MSGPFATQSEADMYFMGKALAQAQLALEHDEIPVGAVVVNDQNEIIGRGFNRVILDSDPTCHAEIVALREAAGHLGNYRLNSCRLYVTLEPCTMCLGAIIHSRLSHLIFGAVDPKTGACGGCIALSSESLINHHCRISAGVRGSECGELLSNFFQQRRKTRQKL